MARVAEVMLPFLGAREIFSCHSSLVNDLITRERFERFFVKGTDCWIWQGSILNSYGQFTIGGYGRFKFKGRMQFAHRISWRLYIGPIPIELGVLHECDVRPCVRPDHLFLGTQEDNLQDAASKGRLFNVR